MKIIEKLSNYIEEEVKDAHKYAKCALEYKDDYSDLSKLFYVLSTEEMSHMDRLHKAVVELIEEHRREKGEPPASMLAVYEYLHNKHIDEAANVRTMLQMSKEQ